MLDSEHQDKYNAISVDTSHCREAQNTTYANTKLNKKHIVFG